MKATHGPRVKRTLCYSFTSILQAFDLAIDESSFTGETEPAMKKVEVTVRKKNNHITQRDNVAFMGTLVRCGNGKVCYFLNLLDKK